jgi:tripartite-type tricarboxylate transporter receptor subunit TctC
MKLLIAAILLALSAAAHSQAPAQAYPTRPITIIFSTSAGGSLDLLSRVLAAHLEKQWGQAVIVQPRPGGGGNVAATALAKSPPDGYMLMMSGSPLSTSLFVKDMPFDPMKDVTPVSLVGVLYYQVLTGRGTGWHNLKDFIAYAKSNPGQLNIGAVGQGTHEVEIDAMLEALDIKAKVINYKGIAPIWLALMANEVQGTLSASAPPGEKTGDIVALAVGGEKRNPEFPDVATFREQGVNYDPLATYYLYAQGATPRALLDRIGVEVGVSAKSPEFRDRVTKTIGIEGVGLMPEVSLKYQRDEYTRLKGIADKAGIVPH